MWIHSRRTNGAALDLNSNQQQNHLHSTRIQKKNRQRPHRITRHLLQIINTYPEVTRETRVYVNRKPQDLR